MAIDQETLNRTCVVVVETTESIIADSMKGVEKIEDENEEGSEKWEAAQVLREKLWKMQDECNKTRRKYPHLFDNQDWGIH